MVKKTKLSKETEYDKNLQKLKSECLILLDNYTQKLQSAYQEDKSLGFLNKDVVNKIREDCMRICSDTLRLTFDERDEAVVIEEILEYNYDMNDIRYMKDTEKINLFSYVLQLNKYCIKKTDPEWFQFGIQELLQNKKINTEQIGSKHTQFCKGCGEQVYLKYTC